MNRNCTQTTFNTNPQLLSANAVGLMPELTDEELAQVYGGHGHMHGHRGGMLERGSSEGGKRGLSLRLHLYSSHYWNRWQRAVYGGHGGHSAFDMDDEDY